MACFLNIIASSDPEINDLVPQARTRHICLDIQTRHHCELPPILQAWISFYAGNA
ncbi:thioesterase family protein [Synechococcus sp. PCC 6312]|uniref:thioesterase family protein n=1 Tax=Synechococcus sp. (strain ATCC 27167 / PCC 6312) TaxID=195253 RepID=UPI001C107202|nr:thioesterase family protein [Synechococcus sp. PCC 6312]